LGGDLPGLGGKNRAAGGSRRPGISRGKGKGNRIAPGEFKDVLRTLQAKPSIEELRDLADRLAATTPTEEQKKKREETRQQRALSRGGAGGNPAVLEQAELADDILQVSRTLNPLLRDSEKTNKKAAVLAMQKWGTEENVPDLAANVEGDGLGGMDVRIAVARALAFIGDERGVPAITRQVMASIHDRAQGMQAALIAFGPKAEAEVRKYLKSTKQGEKRTACEILKQIGTEASIPDLQALESDFFLKTAAKSAVDAIRARQNK
jgi:HEAT repeat protein